SIDTDATINGGAKLAAAFRDGPDTVRVCRISGQCITEITGQSCSNFVPVITAVIAAIGAAMALLVKAVGICRVQNDSMHTLPAQGFALRQIGRAHPRIHGLEMPPTIQAPINATRG